MPRDAFVASLLLGDTSSLCDESLRSVSMTRIAFFDVKSVITITTPAAHIIQKFAFVGFINCSIVVGMVSELWAITYES